jgi:hypothetical protein
VALISALAALISAVTTPILALIARRERPSRDAVETAIGGRSTSRRGRIVFMYVLPAVLLLFAGVIYFRPPPLSATPPKPTGAASTTPVLPSPTLTANGDEAVLQRGQCVRNAGTEDSPILVIAPCGPNAEKVLARINQRIDNENQADDLCQAAAPDYTDFQYTNWDHRPDYVDAVYCLGPA